jgi:molybdopterin synthase catalytic subunit
VTAEVRVSYFAAARELCGTQSERVVLPSPALTARAFLELLGNRHAALMPFLARMRLAVNDEIVASEAWVRAGDEVAVLPPVAGGAGDVATPALCALREGALSVDEVIAAVRRPDAGGIALFLGVVRDHADGKAVARLDYEAHDALALREMRLILDEVVRELPQARVAVLHRTGQLAIGDLAVVVGASAPHRAEAFAACRKAIELVKERVPIWKKEWAPDGSANWVNLE